MAKNVLRKQFGPMYGKNKPYDKPDPLPNTSMEPSMPTIESPSVTVTHVILFTILIVVLVFLYLNRQKVYAFLQKIYKDFKPSDQVDQIEKSYHDLSSNLWNPKIESKIDELLQNDKKILKSIDQCEKDQTHKEKQQESGGVHQIEEKINRYSNEQQVKANGFCYIGYDKNQRECTNVYEGDICMSGQVFPTLAVCLDPHLRP
jgi:hypothetical protein